MFVLLRIFLLGAFDFVDYQWLLRLYELLHNLLDLHHFLDYLLHFHRPIHIDSLVFDFGLYDLSGLLITQLLELLAPLLQLTLQCLQFVAEVGLFELSYLLVEVCNFLLVLGS